MPGLENDSGAAVEETLTSHDTPDQSELSRTTLPAADPVEGGPQPESALSIDLDGALPEGAEPTLGGDAEIYRLAEPRLPASSRTLFVLDNFNSRPRVIEISNQKDINQDETDDLHHGHITVGVARSAAPNASIQTVDMSQLEDGGLVTGLTQIREQAQSGDVVNLSLANVLPLEYILDISGLTPEQISEDPAGSRRAIRQALEEQLRGKADSDSIHPSSDSPHFLAGNVRETLRAVDAISALEEAGVDVVIGEGNTPGDFNMLTLANDVTVVSGLNPDGTRWERTAQNPLANASADVLAHLDVSPEGVDVNNDGNPELLFRDNSVQLSSLPERQQAELAEHIADVLEQGLRRAVIQELDLPAGFYRREDLGLAVDEGQADDPGQVFIHVDGARLTYPYQKPDRILSLSPQKARELAERMEGIDSIELRLSGYEVNSWAESSELQPGTYLIDSAVQQGIALAMREHDISDLQLKGERDLLESHTGHANEWEFTLSVNGKGEWQMHALYRERMGTSFASPRVAAEMVSEPAPADEPR